MDTGGRVATTIPLVPIPIRSGAESAEEGAMEQIQVGRWLFWAGVLMLVGTIVLSEVFGQQSNPPYGTGWDFIPVLIILSLILLLASVVSGNRLDPVARDEPSDSPTGSR